jgi:hypothetical protein
MGFFDDIPRHEEDVWESPRRQAAWVGPPENMVGGTALLDRVLVNSGETAIVLRGAEAFPTGVVLRVGGMRRPAATLRDTFTGFRFGVGLPDGRKLVAGHWQDDGHPTARLSSRGGSHGPLTLDHHYWLWPLPPEGPLTFALKWEREGIGETLVEADSAPLRAAASGVTELWPDDRPLPPKPDGAGWSAYVR